MNEQEFRKTAKAVAVAVLSLAVGHGGGGYYSEFGTVTRKQLTDLITNGFDDYCEVFGHIKHLEMNKCIVCGCAFEKSHLPMSSSCQGVTFRKERALDNLHNSKAFLIAR